MLGAFENPSIVGSSVCGGSDGATEGRKLNVGVPDGPGVLPDGEMLTVGAAVGIFVGVPVGIAVDGSAVGAIVGVPVGVPVGAVVGVAVVG